ncbi:hypothetical protein ANCCAN_28894 [Ancylostoma caninum]|uniref:Uncharacterized protein n=1 Tax=Ancylostoma caninum TaxID=29170 RepID=A0A368F3A7_ANCCA|nr:hypothetical protein ANCCAN_28894 [Ancylostoma caninum]
MSVLERKLESPRDNFRMFHCVLKDHDASLSELKAARAGDASALEGLREENAVLKEECRTLRSSLNEQVSSFD